MTLWSSPHPKESTAISLGQAQSSAEASKMKELPDSGTGMPSSATSFGSDGSEDAGFEDGSIDVDMDEADGLQIDCIQTLTEFEPAEANLLGAADSPLMAEYKTAIPLPAPSPSAGNTYGGNQAYSNIQNALPRITERPSSPARYWGHGSDRHSSREPGDVGLNNIGNTCFMNSGLQCLLHTSPLAEFFLTMNIFERSMTSLAFQFQAVMKQTWFGRSSTVALHDFKTVLGRKYAQFKDSRQHDCQEFLAVLLDMLHEELKSKQKAEAEIMSTADSSVEDIDSKKTQDTTIASSCCSSSVSSSPSKPQSKDTIRDTTIEESSSSSSNVTKVENHKHLQEVKPSSPKGPTFKRQRLDEDESGDVDSQTDLNVEQEGDEEIRRKSAKLEPEVDIDNEADTFVDVEEIENEADELNPSNFNTVHKAEEYWDNYIKQNNTVIASTFQGMFKSSVTCSECRFVSETYEAFMYLSLPIPRIMEKRINVTFISMKDRASVKVEVTIHVMGNVDKLIQEVIKKVDISLWDDTSTYVAAEIVNYRVARVLEEKLQLRTISTNTRNIYVYELNSNFDEKYGRKTPTVYKFYGPAAVSTGNWASGKTSMEEDWDVDDSISLQSASNICSSSGTLYEPVLAPGGGNLFESTTTYGPSVSSTSDTVEGNSFNLVQCNICLEDYVRDQVKQHRGCSCVLCEECLMKSMEHFKGSGKLPKDKSESDVSCAVCLQEVVSKQAFVALEDTPSSCEFITIPLIFRNEPCTDANNNASLTPGLFGYPWLLRVPSYMRATDLVDYIESINPVPEANHRILSVKADGKGCGQCVFSSRCNGCEIPKEGMISLNSCNSILISYSDLSSERMTDMQPSEMAIQNELTSSSWQYNYSRNEEPTIDIHDCLRTFSETEHLDEQNPWFCPRCEKNQRATKALSICKFPDYLIVYLKRFVFLDQSSNKLNNRLTFPINDLDVSDYVADGFGCDLGKYNLYSCVCHFGNANAGHYTAFSKNPVTNKWHYFNDDTISNRSPAEDEYESAYVLFYEKQGMVHNIPTGCSKALPELNIFNMTSSYSGWWTNSANSDTRGSCLPRESISSGPVRMSSDYMSDMNLQVDSTSPSFTYPHPSTEDDIGFDIDEGVGNETNQIVHIRDGLGFSESDTIIVTSTSAVQDDTDDFGCLTPQIEMPSTSMAGGADSTSN